jgi:hypothetical protein
MILLVLILVLSLVLGLVAAAAEMDRRSSVR